MLDDDGRGLAAGQQADAIGTALRQADLVEELVGELGVVLCPLGRILRLEQLGTLHDRIVGGLGKAEIDDLVQLVAVDGHRQGATEADVTHQIAPFLIGRGQVGIECDLRARAGLPQANADARCLGALLQEGVVAHVEIARLQVGFAEARLGRDQVGRCHGHDHLVDIGQLLSLFVDAVIVGVACEDVALGRVRCREDPRVQRRHVDIAVAVHDVLAPVDVYPAATLVKLQDLLFGRVLAMELLEVVRRPEEEERCGSRLALDEVGVGLVPSVLDRQLVNDLDLGRFAVDDKFDRRAGRRQLGVVGNVFPEETEIVGGKGMAVRPLVPGPQLQGELAAFLDFVAFQDVGMELELVVVHDQASVAVDRHQARIAHAGDQHVELTALLARAVTSGEPLGDPRLLGNTLGDRRQRARLHLVNQLRRLLQRRQGIGGECRRP